MSVTLSDVIKIPVIRQAEPVTRNHRLQTPISGVIIMESADALRRIKPDVVLCIDLCSVLGSPNRLDELIDALSEHHPCALVIRRKGFEMPPALLDLAEDLMFAILAIPDEMPYSQFIYPVTAALLESQTLCLEKYRETQTLLTNQALKNTGYASVIRTFSEIIRNPACLYDNEMTLLFSTHPAVTEGGQHLLQEDEGNGLYRRAICLAADGTEKFVQFLTPIRIMDDVVGYLGAVEKERTLNDLDFIAMQNATSVLHMEMLKSFTTHNMERNMRAEVVDEIIFGRGKPNLWGRAASSGLYMAREYAVVHVAHYFEGNLDKTADPLFDRISNLIQRCLNRHKITGVITTRKDRTILFVQAPAQQNERTALALRALLKDIAEDLRQIPGIKPPRIGYSSRFVLLEKAQEAYSRAAKALRAGGVMDSVCCNYEELGAFKFLGRVTPEETMEEMLPMGLHRLMAYDKAHKACLTQTLEAYFVSSRNAMAAARLLFIHPKTMRYRLSQIAKIANLDDKNRGKMLEMELGLMLMRLTGESAEHK